MPSFVRPSATFVYYIETSKHTRRLIDTRTMQFFLTILWQYSGAGVKSKWRRKNRDFRAIFRFISEMIQVKATVSIERQQELVCRI